MARLASQAKLGYYKTPVPVVEHIKKALAIGKDVRMLDPCCGEGDALNMIAYGANAQTLGIELEKDRFHKSVNSLTKVLWADALTEAVISDASVDLLYLNPPYDFDDGDENRHSERFEYLFLKKYLPALAYDGLLIFIVPLRELQRPAVRDLLAGSLKGIQIVRFPDGEFDSFKQVVVVGTKGLVLRDKSRATVDFINAYVQRPSMMPTTEEIHPISVLRVRVSGRKRTSFYAHHIDPQEIMPLTQTLRDRVMRDFEPDALNEIHPLMPLRNGHMAMLLAAGFVNGELRNNDEHLVIKGSVAKAEEVSEQTETDTHRITRTVEKVVINVRMLNMATGEIETIDA